MLTTIILLLIGLAILVGSAESLVRGAASISKKLGIPPIVIGLTVVAFGTSAPELVVNVFSAVRGTTDLAFGNIIGSNIANILLVLGLAGLFINLKVQKNTTWKEIPFAVLAVLLVYAMANDRILDAGGSNVLTRTDGLALLGFFAIFMYYALELFRRGTADNGDEVKTYSLPRSIALTVLGLAGLFLGGKLLVDQAVILATLAGLSEVYIGLTIVAVGTSLPELATSVIAARRGEADIAVGNVVGSNIFNNFLILGITSVIRPVPIGSGQNLDILVCLIATALLFLAMFVGKKHTLERWQSGLFLIGYIAYLVFITGRG